MPTLAAADTSTVADDEDEKDSDVESPPFGLSLEYFEELLELPPVDFACKLISITLDYYDTLPCPATLSNSAPNVWKMNVFVTGDPLSGETAALTSVFTLWDEINNTYAGAPTKAAVLVASSPFYVDTVEGDKLIDVIGVIGCLNTVAIPSAFGRGFSKKTKKLWKKKELPIMYSGSYGNIPEHFRPYKLIVHDATLQSGLVTFQVPPASLAVPSRPPAKPLKASEKQNVVAAVQLGCPTLAKGWDDARLVCVCAFCRTMGCCKAGPGEIKVMRRCSACRTHY